MIFIGKDKEGNYWTDYKAAPKPFRKITLEEKKILEQMKRRTEYASTKTAEIIFIILIVIFILWACITPSHNHYSSYDEYHSGYDPRLD